MPETYRQRRGHKEEWAQYTFVYHYSDVVWNIVFSNINKEITGFGYSGIESFLINSCIVVKQVGVAVVRPTIGQLSAPHQLAEIGIQRATTHAATSAYVSIASMPFLFFSAIGMMSLRAVKRSVTFANLSSRKVLRYPRR